jgi:Uma2 family endonuclease
MTLADINLDEQDHVVLEDVTWSFYERLLEEIDSQGRRIRVTYDQGRLEMMSPLPQHDRIEYWIGHLIGLLCAEKNIDFTPGGGTTFRSKAKQIGLEPDGCFFFTNSEVFDNLETAWDPKQHPAPDLAIEVDITRKSIAKQPIYAKLGIKELWRFDGKRLSVLILDSTGAYQLSASSTAFPFLPMQEFESFLHRFGKENNLTVIRAFQQWARSLAQ